MEAHEVGDTITESAHNAHPDEQFRRGAAVFLGVLGMLLAIASLAGENAMKETINANILASDTYAFYQARNYRQLAHQLAAESLEALLASNPDMPNEAKTAIAQRIADDRAAATRHESDGDGGKQGLLAKARGFEAQRDLAQRRDTSYDYSRALFQIAIVLGSVSIVAASRPLLWLCAALGLAASALAINGAMLLVELPLG